MEDLYHFIRESTAGLYVTIYTSRFFFIDYWSFVHLFSGVLLIAASIRLGVRRRWLATMGVLVGYELLELAFIYLSIGLFLPETIPDQVTDVFVGALGGLAAESVTSSAGRRLLKRFARNVPKGVPGDLLLSSLLAFTWVRFYGYRYNVPFLNSPFLSWWAFTIWTTSLFAMLCLHRSCWSRGWTGPRATGVVWAATLALTLSGEFVGYRVLGIREVRGYPPLILGLVHGTLALKLTYVFAPPLVFGGLTLARKRWRAVDQ